MMLDLLLYVIFLIALLMGSRWIIGALVQTFISLLSSLVSLMGTIVILGGVVWIFSLLIVW